MENKTYDSIVVGGGIAGLTSAAYLAESGQSTLLIEKNSVCGGLVNSFKRDGFHFDAGVRALEDAGIIFPMLKDLGLSIDVVKSNVSVGVGNEILNIKDIDSLNDYGAMLIRLYPESESDIKNLIKIIRKIMKHMEILYGIENPVFKDLKKDRAFVFKTLLPWLPRFIFTVGKINKMSYPVEGYLEGIIKDRSLRDIISQHFFKNTPTFFALSYFSLYLDYFYPKGGVGKLADLLVKKITDSGGEVINNTFITDVEADKNQVKDDKGNLYSYKNLIWAADLKNFHRVTKTDSLPTAIKQKFKEKATEMESSRGGDSVYSIFLEIDEPLESFGKIANGHFFYTPSKKGLGETHWTELQELLKSWDNKSKQDVFEWFEKFIRLNTFEISIPGLKDSSLVPDGKTGMTISFLAEYDLFKKIQSSEWYTEFKEFIEYKVVEVITESIYPMLKDKLIKSFSFSPLSIESRVGSSEGAITGWTFEKPVPVVNKIHISDRSVITPISNIYQAGQWAYSPAGVPMSILTGKLAADKVLKKKAK